MFSSSHIYLFYIHYFISIYLKKLGVFNNLTEKTHDTTVFSHWLHTLNIIFLLFLKFMSYIFNLIDLCYVHLFTFKA